MIKTAILGASGYTGFELMRILAMHPEVAIHIVTSRQYKGKKVAEVFPALSGIIDKCFEDTEDLDLLSDVDLVFSALPHITSQHIVARVFSMGKKVIDLSADFRLKDVRVYKKWYGEHRAGHILEMAVYGLPEFYKERIKDADVVANPGCYPTGSLLGLLPIISKGIIDTDSIVIDAKSGASGAGRILSKELLFVEVNESFKAYNVGGHRHMPEIEQELSQMAARDVKVTFIPHLLPLSRGILTTIYASLNADVTTEDILSIYKGFYEDKPFVRIMDNARYPDISQVKGSNFCDIGLHVDNLRGRIVIITAIDNLMKGASGQAVQNMNIMYDLPEESGLIIAPSPL